LHYAAFAGICISCDYHSTFFHETQKTFTGFVLRVNFVYTVCRLKMIYRQRRWESRSNSTRKASAEITTTNVRFAFLSRANNKTRKQVKGVHMIIKGVGIGRGVAVGPVIRMAQPLPEPSDAPRAEGIAAESEIARVEKSLALVNADLNRRAEEAANGDEGAKQAAPILQAIAMFASDPSLAQSIKDLINQGKTAERAVLEGFGAVEDMFRAIGGYQAERAADLHDVGQRVIADLMGAPAPGLPVSETPFVLVAEDLSPADTAALDMSKTLAIVTSQGGPTSHTAILARARGIVAVVSAAEAAEFERRHHRGRQCGQG